MSNVSPEIVSCKVPFQISSNGGVAVVTDEAEAIRQMMISVLMTNDGERIMLPRFGANVQARLFEDVDSLVSAQNEAEIMEELRTISPLLTILGVKFSQNPNEPSAVELSIQYSINSSNSLLRVRIPLNGIITNETPI
jgi:uncharacterized protein